jgi:receptor protein-tyrosine kinase
MDTALSTSAGHHHDGEVLPPVPASDPDRRVNFSPTLVQLRARDSAEGESVAALRNYLINQHVRDGRRALAVCAARDGTGCTFVATNLAIAMAQAGLNTLLIDANMRSPGIDRLIAPVAPVPGLRDFLESPDDVSPYVVGQVIHNLSILYAGQPADNAQELLSSARLKTLFDDSVRTFDLTIVDCPPTANYSDARRIASLLRHAVVIARRDHSLAHDMKTLIGELKADRVNVVGTILNNYG